MKQLIYADNAATTKLDDDAFEAMRQYLLDDYGNASQPYSFSRKVKNAIKIARKSIADCINAEPEEIYFTSGGTESDNWAIKGSAFGDVDHKQTITSTIEHHAILHSCQSIERMGYPVTYLRVTHDGEVTSHELERAIGDDTRLVSIMFANNEIGTIQPVHELCTIAHNHGAIFHTDAVQAVGHIPINVKELGIDMLSASAHKFNGPKGSGFLYIRKGIAISPYADGGHQESSLRSGTENVASIVGMAIALKKNCDSLNHNSAQINGVERLLIKELYDSGIAFRRNGGTRILPGMLSLSFEGADGEALLHRLDLQGICISTGAACNSADTRVSHVLEAIGLTNSVAKGTIRISLGKSNTQEQISHIVSALSKALGT